MASYPLAVGVAYAEFVSPEPPNTAGEVGVTVAGGGVDTLVLMGKSGCDTGVSTGDGRPGAPTGMVGSRPGAEVDAKGVATF